MAVSMGLLSRLWSLFAHVIEVAFSMSECICAVGGGMSLSRMVWCVRISMCWCAELEMEVYKVACKKLSSALLR